ncbi:hypothetical protein EX895_003739 [Sporisorium graminicola]|uniref:Zn(2)-C6 fungal-type domain-containing protein n=1 Tax=Sporisorium graminicola TaxID=280036 RepID=A0A4U7KVV6_9BASI|nr:hypothetical protein EX895_003739 [Sporisorium graminicola]TKY87062.1 hypothetical protein EX895_003739 [Sporisorium graminicola]
MSSPHSKPNPADSGRVRSSRACLSCSRRKVKCDGLQPCNNCSKDSTLCEYGARKKRGPPKGCDPRGGRRKKAQELGSDSKSSLPTKVSPPSTVAASVPHSLFTARSSDERPAPQHYPSDHTLPRSDHPRSPLTPPKGEEYRTSQPDVTSSLSAKTSFEARFSSADRAGSTSYPSRDPHPAWSRPSYEPPSTTSPPFSSHSSHRVDGTSATSASHAHHYLQPQLPAHPHSGHHHPDRSWPSSSSADRHSQHQTASSTHSYDAYPLQAPLRDYSRASPLASHHSMPPPPHTISTEATTHSLPSVRTNGANFTPTYPTHRPYPGRGLHDGPAGLYQSGSSVYDRASTLPPASSLTRRHPVSASRLTEAATTSAPLTAQWTSAASPAFTSASHGYSPSTAAVHHRSSWHNGSQPPSPLGPASLPRSQVSSPGTHWHDHNERYSPATGDHVHPSSSKVHLEDRLPTHILQRLLDIYITFVHPHWPIIYLPSIASLHSLRHTRPVVFEAILAVASNTFDAYLDSASQDDQQSSIPVLERLYAESPQSTEPAFKSNELRDHFLQRVKTRIFEGKFTQDIGTIQAAILVSVVELGSGHSSSAFQFGGIACRMALDMNLHRCTAQSSSTAGAFANSRDIQRHDDAASKPNNGRVDSPACAAQLQEKMRVFWACYIVDKILSTALDKPTQLRMAEIEADWPSVQEADEYDLWLNETTGKFVDKSQLPYLEGVKVHALSSFKAWAEVMAILERILEEVYSPQAKRDRHRTKGVSDYEALLRLNDRLIKWRADLPPHLKWSGTWTSPELLSSTSARRSTAERKECDPHRGFPPQILTMRSWYCICLILLHRPRVPKLLCGSRGRSSSLVDETGSVDPENQKEPTGEKGQKSDAQAAVQEKGPELAGLDICNAAAKEVCDILHVYGSSFRIRKISSSWVYLIFQSATIHAALAASKSVVVFKARQSTIWSRQGSAIPPNELSSAGPDGAQLGDEGDLHAAGGGDAEAHRVTEAELEGSSEPVKSSALYLAECVRYLKRIGPTWQSASHHVAVLRNLCIASAQARPLSPSVPHATVKGTDQHASQASNSASAAAKTEDHDVESDLHPLPDSEAGHALQQHGDWSAKGRQHDAGAASDASGVGNAQQSLQQAGQNGQHAYHGHESRAAAALLGGIAPTTASSNLGLGASHEWQYLQPANHTAVTSHAQLLAAPSMAVNHQHAQQQPLQQVVQQSMYAINANDSTFWASMPVASEGYNDWDEFFKTFNPGAGADFASQQVNYHPTAALDLITALQDPNRLLSSLQQQQ